MGYEDVKVRKATDEGIRKYWYDQTLLLIDEYSKVQNQLMQGQLLSTWPASNAILTMLNDLRTVLSTDKYRHSTFFETPDVSDSLDLEVIYVLESETILQLRDILDDIHKMSAKLRDLELLDIEKDVFAVKEYIEEVKTTITDRAELIASFELVGI
ncbi:MAG: hypothetical protein ACXAE3_12160 [Candidatus Kariarchaeaceae archaeon]